MIKKAILSLVFIALATLFLNVYGRFFIMPSALKAAVSLLVWLAVIFIPYKNNNDFSRTIRIIMKLILFYSLAQLIRSVVYMDEITTIGNNWFTLFGNDSMAQSLIPPLFIYYYKDMAILKKIQWAILVLLFFVVLTALPQGRFLPYAMAFAIPFFYYRKSKIDRFAILVLTILGLLGGFASARILLLTTAVSLAALYLPRLLPANIFKIVLFSLFFLPFGLISWSLTNATSGFEVGLQNVEDDELSVDTRTFLYLELFEDLQDNNAVWFGKGALSGYQSSYFETDKNTIGRTSSEVYFLHLMLKGGIVYLLLIQSILFMAVYNAFKKGNNQLSKSFAFAIAGFSCLSFIGDFLGANILHVTIWVMVGFCLSSYWTSRTDQQLMNLIYKK
jgi:hypothetical protein